MKLTNIKNAKRVGENVTAFSPIGVATTINYINKYIDLISSRSGIGFTTIHTYNGKSYGFNFPASRLKYNLILNIDLNKLEELNMNIKEFMLGIFQMILDYSKKLK